MCGICGKYTTDQAGRPDGDLLRKMAGAMIHRGPDEEGFFCEGPIGLGHRRLSIIDLATGRQPMANEDETVWLICNGEIYNHRELREDLEKKGHRFKTRSDSEVILHLYEDCGEGCLQRLRGMFAFAVWDSRRRRLFLARDRAGQKPLVYAQTREGLVFASEIRALLEDESVSRELDFESLNDYLTYLYIPAPRTIFKQIRKLPAAHYLVAENGEVAVRRYWRLTYANKLKMDEADCLAELRRLFEEAVKIRLMSEVPLGALLSGGIDSGAVVAAMSRLCAGPVKTFSIGYENDTRSELSQAAQTARMCGTDHQEWVLKPDVLRVLPELARRFGEPFGDVSAVPTYYVSQFARSKVTVALSGDGGDESFAGYERYVTGKVVQMYRRLLPRRVREAVPRLFSLLPDRLPAGRSLAELKTFLKGTALPEEKRLSHRSSLFTEDFKRLVCTEDLMSRVSSVNGRMAEIFLRSDGEDYVDRLMDTDIQTFLPDDILVKVDIAGMAHSLEVRSPFLDHRLMEFAACLPAGMKLRGFQTKALLKKMVRGDLPATVLKMPKRGFVMPVGDWLQSPLLFYKR